MTAAVETRTELHELIRSRWSPRAFSAEPIPPQHINALLEAARWAPSSMNEQPWSILVASRETDPDGFDRLASTLVPGNAVWATKAPVLMLVVARSTFSRTGRPNRHALYDTGAAVAQLTTQATALGISVHQMGGFDAAQARELLGIPETHEPVVVLAVGYRGDPETLPEDLQRREVAPRLRRPMSEWVFGALWGEQQLVPEQ